MLRNITILKTKGPDQLWVKEIPGPNMSEEAEEYQVLVTQINAYCESTDMLNEQIIQPSRGQYCLARRSADHQWYRAKIEGMLVTTHGTQASCLLLDYAERIQVSVQRLCEIPAELLHLPFQAKVCRLHGIQPLTLAMSFETFTSEMIPCANWDIAATEFFNDIIKDKSAKMRVHRVGRDDVYHITLFVNVEKELVNVNNELVTKKFAAFKEDTDIDDYSSGPAPSLEAMAILRSQGSASSREGSVRALSPEVGIKDKMSSPPLATRQVSPSAIQGPKDEQQILREKFHNSLKLHKVSAEGILEKSRKDAMNKDRGKQGSPKEILTTAEVKEKIQQLGMSKGQQRNVSAVAGAETSAHNGISAGQSVKTSSGVAGQETSPPKGRGMALLYQLSHGSSDDSASPVGRQNQKSPANTISPRGVATPRLNSSPELVQPAPTHAVLRAKSPLSSDYLSSGDDSQSDKKLKARMMLEKLAAHGHTRLSSEDEDRRRSMSPDQKNVKKPSAVQRPDDIVNRPPFRKRTSSEEPTSSAGESPTPSKSKSGSGRKTFGATRASPSRWSDDSRENASIIEQRIKQMIQQPSQKRSSAGARCVRIPPGILVHGEMRPEPCTRFDDTNLNMSILKILEENVHFSRPLSIQSFAWPAIFNGRDMIGVAPKESGKKLAYLLPILSQIMQPSSYTALPIGTGPLAVVVCASWKRADEVYNQCLQFIGKNRKQRALLLYGAGSEENNQVQLVNGKDIVIVTVPCLLRLLKGGHTNLNRLCHLVFDAADVLFSDFTDEIKQLMNEYAGAIAGWRPNLKSFKQLLVFSSTWTPALNSFLNNYMTDPVVAITAPLEAAVYAHIKWMAQITRHTERFQYLCSVLDSCQASASKVAVFVNTRKEAESLQKMLVNAQYYSLLAHKEMGSHHIDQVMDDWRASHRGDSVPVLVLTDDIIKELGITNATCVIHYTFPNNRRVLGNRLGIMMDNFASQIDGTERTKKKKHSNCQTMLLVDKEHSKYLPSLSHVLSRCSRDLSERLGVDNAIQTKESEKQDISLCHHLKRLGYCKEFPMCPDRHQIRADLDAPGCQSLYMELPQSGIIKIHITYIVDASCYHGRILEYRSSEGSDPVDMTSKYSTLGMDLAMWYGMDTTRKQIHGSPQVNALCAYEDDQRAFHRVRVAKVVTRNNVIREVKIHFVDEGRYMDIPATKLLKLPPRFHSIPFQAVEIFVCRVKPVDKDTDWTEQAGRHIHDMIYKEEMEGKIALSLGNTLWLNPLVQRVFLEEVKTMGDALNVRQELMKNRFAENNPEHLTKLRKLCQGQIELPQLVPSVNPNAQASTILRPDIETLDEADVTDVYLSAVANPGLFYVQKCSMFDRLQKLYDKIQKGMETVEDDASDWAPQIGDICLAKFDADQRWSRGIIVATNDAEEFDVFFVDYGDQEWKSRKDMRQPWNEILRLSFQAIKCSLADIGPLTEQWQEEDEVSDVFWDMCHDENDDNSELSLKVKSVITDRITDSTRYVVDIYENSSSERCINIGHQLVLEKFASAKQDFVKNMFPGSFEEERSISDWLIKLCRQLYEAQDRQRQLELARAIHQMVTNKRCNSADLCNDGALVSLCHLVSMGQMTDPVTNNVLVISLIHVCYQYSRNCREMCKHGGLKEICQFLKRTSDESLQEKICWILKNVAGIGPMVQRCIREYDGVSAICDVLASTQSSKVSNIACIAIGELATNNPRNQDVIHEANGIASLCRMLVDGDIAQEQVLNTMSILASHIRNRDGLRTEGGLKALCELLWEADNEKIVYLLTNSLLSLVESVENRDAMIDEDMSTCLEGHLLRTDMSENTMNAMFALHGYLTESTRTREITDDNIKDDFEAVGLLPPNDVGNTSSKQTDQLYNGSVNQSDSSITVNGHIEHDDDEMPPDLPPLEDDDDIPITATPKVKWSQRRDTITLSVDLRGVSDFNIEVLQKSVYFSTQLDVTYEFHLNLFSHVNTTDYRATALGGEVLITLNKETPAKWPRLTNTKKKMGFVKVDFERFDAYDSSSDEDPRLPKKKNRIDRSKLPTKKSRNAIPPEMDTSSSEDSAYSYSSGPSDGEFGFADESDLNTAT